MANKVQLVLVIHNHQPVGNFDGVINDACDCAYLPFLRMLAEYPNLRLGLHTSGCLWEWLETHRPEYGELVAELVVRGQLELLGGGMYEPILPVLPERDALWQLRKMRDYLHKRFGVTPRGMWCPERVWEPHMPTVIAAAGYEYTLLDDYHFRGSALPNEISRGYFTTEHAGKHCALYPISRKLRYTLPFKPVVDTITHLSELKTEGDDTPLVVFGDDGEKFGVWPETYEWVYEQGWLRDFFTALSDNLDWIDLLLPGDVLDRRRPSGKVFVPCMSYMEMGEWSRVDPDATADDPPGFWRNYLVKYPESNAMYQRMLGVSKLLLHVREQGIADDKLEAATADLGRAQCNCAYWHGIFGGLYLNYLRHSIYFHLLKAECALQGALPDAQLVHSAMWEDNGDGVMQAELRSAELRAVVDPGHGLCLSRLDYYPTLFSFTNVFTRQREAYHAKVVDAATIPGNADEHASIHDRVLLKEEGLADRLVFDPHQRVSFATYFSEIESPDQMQRLPSEGCLAPRFHHTDYSLAATNLSLMNHRISGTLTSGDMEMRKSLQLDGSTIEMQVQLARGVIDADLPEFFVEFNFTLLTDQADDRYVTVDGARHPIADDGQWKRAAQINLVDGWQNRELLLAATGCNRILYYPVYTVSSSEGGFERTYQGSCIMLGYDPQVLLSGITISMDIRSISAREEG